MNTITCPKLSDFDISAPDAVRAAFAAAPVLQMQQAWREAPEEKLLPARVRIGWRGDRFLVFGELTDHLLYTRRTWAASFSRYDYSSAEEPPVLSSTSPHAEVSFHRQQEWADVEFEGSR